ncbi:MAG: hypothetical protein BWK80_53325 [Desulfobacteraceae bacterium IS3]|nr:MAG: hypothetical protein BWK80_53325 [Desulfobacteraceae bacterium IS3]
MRSLRDTKFLAEGAESAKNKNDKKSALRSLRDTKQFYIYVRKNQTEKFNPLLKFFDIVV